MDLYLVRHGETNANARHEYQPPTEPLSKQGSAEVARLVHQIEAIKPTHLYTSDFARARETAQYFGYAAKLEPTWLPLIQEIRHPEHFVGTSHYSFTSALYLLRWFFHIYKTNDASKAETRKEFVNRVLEARRYFETQHKTDDRIVAVTHSVFMNFFIVHLCSDEHVTFFEAVPLLWKIFQYENSGITHVRYFGETEENVCPWQLMSYNQDDHLELP